MAGCVLSPPHRGTLSRGEERPPSGGVVGKCGNGVHFSASQETRLCSIYEVGAFSQAGRRGFESGLPLHNTLGIIALGAMWLCFEF